MKYTELLQLQTFFSQFKKIDFIKRINDNVLELSFDRERFIFDLTRAMSAIYTAKFNAKNYNAPFDFMLKKYFSNAFIKEVKVLEGNRILCFSVKANKAYKSYESKIYFEFTGKNTNVILTDKKDLIIEALRHIDKSYRVIKPNVILESLKPYKMDENFEEIKDFADYFSRKFTSIYESKIKQIKNLKLAQVDKKIQNLQELFSSLDEESSLLLKALEYRKRADVLFANLSVLKDYEREFKPLLPKNYELANDGLKIQDFSELKSLEGFKPKIIEGVASNSDYSISDALESFELFKAQNVNTDALKINLYKFVFTPFFAPFLMLIMYYFFPVIARFFNLAFVTFIAFVVTLMIWGVLFLLTRLSENSVIASEIGIVVPIIILGCLSAYMYYKHR